MKKVHFNPPQLRSMAVMAPVEVCIWARATGKSQGVLAKKSQQVMDTLPRSCTVSVSATFQQQLTLTLPGVIAGWETLGYKQGIHYLIGVKPPLKWRKQWRWDGPYRPPLKFEYVISWWNGSVMQLVSQDRVGSSNGLSIDYIIGDESKYLNHERLKQELFPTNRGIKLAFADNPLHHGMTFTTDMPRGTAGRWLFEYADLMDANRVQMILKLQATCSVLTQQLLLTKNKEHSALIKQQLRLLQYEMNQLRRGVYSDEKGRLIEDKLVYYHEANTLDNIHALGVGFIKQLMRDLPDADFTTSILNRKPVQVENGYYPDLDEEKHGYFAFDYHVFESVGYEFDKLQQKNGAEVDADYDADKPLHGAFDYNRRIVPLVVAHVKKQEEIKVINHIYVEAPYKLIDTLKAFCTYYRNHNNRVFYYWYDHTAIGQTANSNPPSEEVINYLRSQGWTVIPCYIGVSMNHEERYRMYGHLLQEDGVYPYVFRMNRERCKHVFTSMFMTPARYGKSGFEKDKSKEKDPNFPALEAPHSGEAVDMLVSGVLSNTIDLSEHRRQSDGIAFL